MQLEFGSDKIWNCFRIFSMRCNWNLARTMFGISLDNFRGDGIGFWLGQDLDLFQNISMRRNWSLAKTRFGTVLDYFR